MIEDKLTKRQRIRLEALAQVQQGAHLHFPRDPETGRGGSPSTASILAKAEEIEDWLLAADIGVN